jgi:HTH-type transcriptional regulator/antitoxin HigA
MKTIATITNDTEHYAALEQLIALHEAPSVDLQAIAQLGDVIHAWERRNGNTVGEIETPETIADLIELEMFKLRLTQRAFANMLEITETRLSEVMRGKREVNMDLARKLYKTLGVKPDLLLTLPSHSKHLEHA